MNTKETCAEDHVLDFYTEKNVEVNVNISFLQKCHWRHWKRRNCIWNKH